MKTFFISILFLFFSNSIFAQSSYSDFLEIKKLFNQKLNLSDLAGDIPGIPQEIKDLNIKAELDFKDIRKPSTGVLKVEIPIGDGTTFRANLPTKLKKVGKGNISVNLPTEFGEFTLTAPADLKNKEQGFSLGLSGRF